MTLWDIVRHWDFNPSHWLARAVEVAMPHEATDSVVVALVLTGALGWALYFVLTCGPKTRRRWL